MHWPTLSRRLSSFEMAKEDAFGRAVYLKRGEVLTAKDGRQITAVGNEVARLERLLKDGHTG
jgi:hypothetical protein